MFCPDDKLYLYNKISCVMAMVHVSPRGSREVMLARPLSYAMI